MHAIQLLCLFDEIRMIFEPLTIAIFQLCLLPKMRLSVDLKGRLTGYKFVNWRIRFLMSQTGYTGIKNHDSAVQSS